MNKKHILIMLALLLTVVLNGYPRKVLMEEFLTDW
jgi:hypothetical protein